MKAPLSLLYLSVLLLASCGEESVETDGIEQADATVQDPVGDEFDEARANAYAIVQDTIRGMMKEPESTHFPEMPPFEEFTIKEDYTDSLYGKRIYEHDSVTFEFIWFWVEASRPRPSSIVSVAGPYESKKLGVWVPGSYTVLLSDAKGGKRRELIGAPILY